MTLNIKAAGAWHEAEPKVKQGGVWHAAESYVKQSGVWYQASSNGLKILIDSAETLYDFNLKTWLQQAGLWKSNSPMRITELRVSSRTKITQYIEGNVLDQASTDLGENPKGYIRSFVQGAVYNYYQENPDLYPAFTTGDEWPAGSSIGVFEVDGSIYGRGADGLGAGVSLRHAYPALKITIPTETLSVSGGVFGGGASGTLYGFFLGVVADWATVTNPIPLHEWPDRLTGEFLFNNPSTHTSPQNTSSIVRGLDGGVSFPSSMPAALNPGTGLLAGLYGYGESSHGGGGGQGGGLGGLPLGYGDSLPPLRGGDGTFNNAGAVSRASILTGVAAKMSPSASWQDPTGVMDGYTWGAERDDTETGRYFLKGWQSTEGYYAPVPPNSVAGVLQVGIHSSGGITLRVFKSHAGAAILGASNVLSIPSLTNIKGKHL